MRYRRFGNTDLKTSEVGFGCARIGGIFQGSTRADYRRALRTALDGGINFFDTADMYCNGESERILGEAFSGLRDRVIISSKAGYSVPRQRHLAVRFKPLLRPVIRMARIKRHRLPATVTGSLGQDFSPEYLVRSVEGSLSRLRTDYLDVFHLHSPPASILEAGGFFRAIDKLKSEGKVRYFGVSCDAAEDALICLRYPSIDSLELEISLLATDALKDVVPRSALRGIGVIARQCMGGGLLTKALDDLGLENIIPDPARRAELAARIAGHHEDAEARGMTVPQFALEFVLGQGGVSVALLGMRTEHHVVDNLRMLERMRPATAV